MSRPCSRCGTAMGRLVETCPSCGTYNKAELPLYVWALGGLLVLLLMLMLGDPGAIVQVVGKLIATHGTVLQPAS